MKTGIELIAEERQEQITKHNRSIDYDVKANEHNQLSDAASILCSDDWGCNNIDDLIEDNCPHGWDANLWAKMLNKPHKERLIIAGALIAAELDRLISVNSNEPGAVEQNEQTKKVCNHLWVRGYGAFKCSKCGELRKSGIDNL